MRTIHCDICKKEFHDYHENLAIGGNTYFNPETKERYTTPEVHIAYTTYGKSDVCRDCVVVLLKEYLEIRTTSKNENV
jgi:hypothetical protein